jgi:hypothetical protein
MGAGHVLIKKGRGISFLGMELKLHPLKERGQGGELWLLSGVDRLSTAV